MFLVFAITIGLVGVATVCDLRDREIPDWISVLLVLCSVSAIALGFSPLSYWGMGYGMVVGLIATYPFFHVGGIGGGDVKLVAAIGAMLGPFAVVTALFWMALVGGALAVIAKLRGRADFAYVPAILAGIVIAMVQSGGMP